MIKRLRTLSYAVLVAVAFAVPFARAADEDIVNVVDQAKWQMAPLGIRTGAFLLSPGIRVSESYDDNVYRDETNEQSDFITTISPSFSAVSDWNLHRVFFNANASFGRYADNGSEDYDDFSFTGGGQLDLDYATFLRLTSSYSEDHERRDSVDDPNADEPVEFSLQTHKLAFTRALGIIKLYLEGIYDSFTFEDSQRGALRIDNSGRDRDIYTLNMRVAYEYFPDYNVYFGTSYDWRRYDNAASSDRDSEGLGFQVGTDLYVTGKIKADVYAGYITRQYDGNFKDVDAFNYGGSLIWNVTGLTSVTAEAKRGIQETTFGDVSGNLQTRLEIGVDHALKDNVFLHADTWVQFSEFESSTAPRDDVTHGIGVSAEYMPFEGASLKLGYDYSTRDSDNVGGDFTDNRVMLTLSKRF